MFFGGDELGGEGLRFHLSYITRLCMDEDKVVKVISCLDHGASRLSRVC